MSARRRAKVVPLPTPAPTPAPPEPMLTPTATLRVVQLALEGIEARTRTFTYDSEEVRADVTPILLLLTESLCNQEDYDEAHRRPRGEGEA
jgi:hypothetical protein